MLVFKQKRVLVGLSIMVAFLAGVYLYSHYNPEDYHLFPKCPVYLLTGYECPGCGSQRAFHNLFQGNFIAAFNYNPLMILLIPYVLSGIYFEYIADRTATRIVRLRNILFGKWAAPILAVIILLYFILRNI